MSDDDGSVNSRRQFALSVRSKQQWKYLTRIGLIKTQKQKKQLGKLFILGAEFSQIASRFRQSLVLRLHINLTIDKEKKCIFFACALKIIQNNQK